MSKFIRNLILAFSLLCAIVLVVFCIQLIVLNWGRDNREIGSSISISSPDASTEETGKPEPTDTEPSGEPESPEDTDQNGDEVSPDDQVPSSEGDPYELLLPDNVHTLKLSADKELYEYSEGEDVWFFTYKGGGEAKLEIGVALITPPNSVAVFSKGFLENYLEGGEATAGRAGKIGKSSLQGVFVTGTKDNLTFEAWVQRPLNGEDFGLAATFVIYYENNEQKTALYSILNSFEMISEETEEIVETEDVE